MKLKKFIASLLALASISSIGAMTVSAEDGITYTYPTVPGTYRVGDVTEDGQVRNNDVQNIRMSLLHIGEYNYTGNRLADANKDGQVRNNDVQMIRMVILHIADESTLGTFTIYGENVLGGEDTLPLLNEVNSIDFTSEVVSQETIKSVADSLISSLQEYANMTPEQKSECDSKQLAEAMNTLVTNMISTLKAVTPGENLETLAETISNIVAVYESLGISKEELINLATTLLSENGITIDANDQAYLLSIFAQAKAIYDANGGVITASELSVILESLNTVV